MEDDLVVVSRSIVIPRNANKSSSFKKKIHLLPWDLSRLRFGYLQRGLLFSKPYPKIDILLSRLQTSLSLALDRFYPLAGRLVKLANDDDNTVSFHISCDGSGVEFVHAVARRNIEVSDILRLSCSSSSSSSSSVPTSFSSFFPATGVKNCNGVSRSLLMVQVTEMKDGIFIGFGYNSTVADGESIWKFLNCWSEICSKGLGSEASCQRRLQLKGWFFDEIDYPIRIPDPRQEKTTDKDMADVVVLSKTIVRPDGSDSERVKIHLTPWDLFFLRSEYPQRGLLFPKPDPETDIISQLKSSLSLALKIFYPFAGRLVKTEHEETASFLVDCDSSGVTFIHASAQTVSVSDVLEPVNGIVPEFLNRFFPANGVKSCQGVSESLIAFQVTELKDGVFIGFGYNHMIADGSSFWSFFNTWSEICSTGVDRNKKFPPLLLRGWFLDGIDYPIRVPISETVPPPSSPVASSSLLQEKVFRFTSRNISELKSKANGEVSSNDRKISSLQAVSAHMWRSIIRNSDLNPEEVVYCKLLMDMRRRLNPPLEKECFGNVVGFATATTTAGEMLSNGLGWAALQINKTVGSQTDEGFRVFAENWVKEPKIPNHVAVSNSVIVASSPWFNVYGNDFGWGKPIAVRAGPGNTSDGKLIVYPGIEEGNIEIQTCLSSHVLEKLSTDAEFLKHACLV